MYFSSWTAACHAGKPRQEHKARTWKQKLKQRPQRNATSVLLWVHIHRPVLYSPGCLRSDGTNHSGLDSPVKPQRCVHRQVQQNS